MIFVTFFQQKKMSQEEDNMNIKLHGMSRQEVLQTWYGMLRDAVVEIDDVVLPPDIHDGPESRFLPEDQRQKLLQVESLIDGVTDWLSDEIEKEEEAGET